MWFATPGGLSAFSKGHWQAYGTGEGLPSDNVNCLLEDSTGVLWAGTTAGLAFRGPKGFQVPVALPSALGSAVLGLAEDRFGWFWIATANHVLRVNRDKLRLGALSEGDIREYGLTDGLRGLEGVKRHRSVVSDPEGRIWFSLNRGISVVDPARLTRNSAPAIPHVQAIMADGNPVSLNGAVHISGAPRRITVDFTGLSLSVPQRVRFRYRLEGFDHGWSEPSSVREAVYTNLPPRSYRFRLVASNPDGVWNSNEAAVAFDVDPLFWQTWWFRAICHGRFCRGLPGCLPLPSAPACRTPQSSSRGEACRTNPDRTRTARYFAARFSQRLDASPCGGGLLSPRIAGQADPHARPAANGTSD